MPVRIYRSGDSGAPVIGRTTGALITLLDAVLVNGYGAKSPLGWTKTFSTTNQAMYRQGTGSTQRYLYVNDTSNADYAQVRGVCNPTSIATVDADVFPSTYESLSKPDSGWMVVGNEKAFYLFCNRASWGTYPMAFFFGDIVSVGGTSDAGRCALWGSSSSGVIGGGPAGDPIAVPQAVAFAGGRGGPGPMSDAAATVFAPALTYATPNSFGGGFLYTPVAATYTANLVNSSADIRGFFPGLYRFMHPENSIPLAHGAAVSGTGLYAGKTFEVMVLWSGTAEVRALIETSDTWSN